MALAVRFIPLAEEQMHEEQRSSHVRVSDREGTLYEAIQSKGLTRLQRKEQIIQTLKFVMNSVTRVELTPRLNADNLYLFVTNKGHGCLCSGTTHLFHSALNLLGIPSRRTSLKRDLLDKYDTHATVEVFFDG